MTEPGSCSGPPSKNIMFVKPVGISHLCSHSLHCHIAMHSPVAVCSPLRCIPQLQCPSKLQGSQPWLCPVPVGSAHIAASPGLGKGEGTMKATTAPITNGDVWDSGALLQLSEYLRVKNDLSTALSSQKPVPFLSSPLKNKIQDLITGSFYPLLLLLSLQGLFSLCSVNCFHSHSQRGLQGGSLPCPHCTALQP